MRCCRFRTLSAAVSEREDFCGAYFSQDVPAALLNFKIDLGVISYVPQEPKLVAIPFFKDKLTLVVNPKHRLAKRRT